MSTNTRVTVAKSDMNSLIVKRMIQVVVVILIEAAILFISAGRLDWVAAWAYIAIYLIILTINAVVLLRKDPELIAERAQVKEDSKGWDRLLASVVSIIGPLITFIVAGLDVRYGWTSPLPAAVQVVGLVVVALGYLLVSWAMASNKFFSGVVRIQKDRGHTVASAGPYQYVRHPGYVGMMMFQAITPVALGSLWALVPALITACLFVVRTALEDRTLQAELDGYRDYAQRVRYRLLPGVW